MPVKDGVRWRSNQRAAGARWFNGLSYHEKDILGDAFVFGTFDWGEWGFDRRPTAHFLSGAEQERIYWEVDHSCPPIER